MKKSIFWAFSFVLFLVIGVGAQSTQIDKYKDFGSILETMRSLAEYAEKDPKKQTMYVSNVTKDETREYAYVYWKEDRSITILHLPLSVPLVMNSSNYYWLTTKARIDLKTDIVPTKDDIGGSTFLVDKSWADSIIRRCKAGVKLRF